MEHTAIFNFQIRDDVNTWHYNEVIMSAVASQITSLITVYSTVYSGTDQRKHQSSALLAFVWGIHRRTVNSPHKWPVTRNIFPLDDVIIDMHSALQALCECSGVTGIFPSQRASKAWLLKVSLLSAWTSYLTNSRCPAIWDTTASPWW